MEKKQSKSVRLDMQISVYEEMRNYCDEKNISMTRLIEYAVDKYIKQEEQRDYFSQER